MLFAIPFPDISPELFSISIGTFDFALRWYALAYIAGLVIGWRMIVAAVKRPHLWPDNKAPMTPEQVETLLTAVVLGVILGGRLGFVIFYQPLYYLRHPLEILQVWQGGMSFHGGLIGVLVAAALFSRLQKVPGWQVTDAMAMVVGVGLLLGRISNFINAELWGRATDLPWGVVFPGAAAQDCPGPVGLVDLGNGLVCARHPSQLYEALLEGALLLAVVLWLAYRRRWLKTPGALSGVFLIIYGTARFLVEFVRQPDAQFVSTDNPVGFALALSPQIGLTMGQILSAPMVLAGIALLIWARRRLA
ncbi:MAG: prolipoprotein diacylglyceryl transferase [Pseudomonadota bacterium]